MASVVEINPLARVEGHGSVRVYLDGGRVERVELCLSEPPRLFEALLVGKGYAEVPEIICRICSLCSTIHKVTALLAVENALGIEVSEATRLTRELIVNGGLIQDHALHLYCLLLPDFHELRGVAELAKAAPELLKAGLAVKRVGNLIQETVGGRLIHPVNIRLGGLGRRIGRDELRRLKDELQEILPACLASSETFLRPFQFPPLPPPNYLALQTSAPPVSGELCRLANGHTFPVERYREHVLESVLPHSHAKHALVDGVEPTVGALARLNLGTALGPRTAGLLQSAQESIIGQDIRGNNLAQAIELAQAAERALVLVDELLEMGREDGGEVEVKAEVGGRGTAACEAPRGVLIHSYGFDENGLCTEADVITPTSLNQGAIARDLLALARALEGADAVEMTYWLERLVRSYDPCISCSVHLVRL